MKPKRIFTGPPYPAHPYDFAVRSTSWPSYAYVSVLADKVEDRHQITVKAESPAELVKLLFTDFNLLPCPKKEDIFRTAAECDRIRKEMQPKG